MEKLKILITDDDSVSLALLKRTLEKDGHSVFEAANGINAWEQFQKNEINMLITDWVMPGMDGLELCRKIRGLKLDYYVYIIMVTANDRKNEAVKGLESGADDYITKPFHPDELTARVRSGYRIKKLEDNYKKINRDLESKNNKLEQLYYQLARSAEETNNAYIELNQVFNVSNDAIWIIDKDFNIVRTNEGFLKLTCNNKEDLPGRKCYEIFPNSLCHTPGCPMKRIQEGHKYFECEIEKEIENHTVPFTLTATALNSTDGLLAGIVVNLKNISSRKQAEALQEAKIMADSSNMAKSDFLANMSHEIRTPLNGILGITELIRDSTENEEHRDLLKSVLSEADNLLRLINDILDFSRIEADKMELDEIAFDLNVMIQDIARTVKVNAGKKGLKFSLDIEDDVPFNLVGDPGRLRQILNNLLGNALKFTHEGEISLKIEKTGEENRKIKLRFLINDTGIGIPEDRQEHILERFTQVDTSTTRNYGGSGLGTTISRQLAEMMGGELGLKSKEGEGSTFWFTSVFSKISEQKKESQGSADLNGRRVLIAAGNRYNRTEIADNLSSRGMITVETDSGSKALQLLRDSRWNNPFDLIMVDFRLEDLDGFELIRKIRAMEESENIPVILTTSVGKPGDGSLCRKIAINGYLTRPFDKSALSGMIELVLNSSDNSEEPACKVITKYSVTEKNRNNIRILVAEDYPLNQKVALKHLESAGYSADLAKNGKEAVSMAEDNYYDLILMDIQMPEMEGFEAARIIRESEICRPGRKNQNHAAIIAMTAHAMAGYRERCLKEGFDDYISKPLKRNSLLSLIDKWTGNISLNKSDEKFGTNQGNPESENEAVKGTADKTDHEPMNLKLMIEEFLGDQNSLFEILSDFIQDMKAQMKNIAKALAIGDAEMIRKEAHAIKGGALNISAGDLSGAAFELEKMGKTGNIENTDEIFNVLKHEVSRLEEFVNALRRQ